MERKCRDQRASEQRREETQAGEFQDISHTASSAAYDPQAALGQPIPEQRALVMLRCAGTQRRVYQSLPRGNVRCISKRRIVDSGVPGALTYNETYWVTL